jgi:Amt family ammonium transporter
MTLFLTAVPFGLVYAEDAVPVPDKGDTAWLIVATILVTLMVLPGLALFYGGMVRSKNMLSILMQVFVIFSLTATVWPSPRVMPSLVDSARRS